MRGREEPAEVSLATEQLRGEVADVRDVDGFRRDLDLLQGGMHRIGECVEQALALARPVAGEVGLNAAQYVDPWFHVSSSSNGSGSARVIPHPIPAPRGR